MSDSTSIKELIDMAVESALDKRHGVGLSNSPTYYNGLALFAVISLLGAFVIVLGLWNVIDSAIAVKTSLSLISIWIPVAIILTLTHRKKQQ